MKNEHYDTEEAYLAALGDALQGRIRGDRGARLPAAARLPGPRARAPHLLPGPPARRFPRLSSSASSRPSTRRSRTCRASASACTSAGAITKARTTATCRSPTSCRYQAGERRRLRAAVRQSAPCARVSRASRIPLADDQILVAGVIDTSPISSSTRRSSPTGSSGSRRRSAIRAACMAGTDCGFDTSAGRAASPRTWSGRSSALSDGARIASQRLF